MPVREEPFGSLLSCVQRNTRPKRPTVVMKTRTVQKTCALNFKQLDGFYSPSCALCFRSRSHLRLQRRNRSAIDCCSSGDARAFNPHLPRNGYWRIALSEKAEENLTRRSCRGRT